MVLLDEFPLDQLALQVLEALMRLAEERAGLLGLAAKPADFFAKVDLPPVPAASVSARAEMAVYTPPRIEAHAKGKAVLAVPAPNWHANFHAKAAPYAHGAWAAPAPSGRPAPGPPAGPRPGAATAWAAARPPGAGCAAGE